MWAQEPLWVLRNKQGVIVGVREKPPENGDFVPVVPIKVKRNPEQYKRKAASAKATK